MLVYFMLGVVCCDWNQQISFISKVPVWCVLGFFAIAEGMNLMDVSTGLFKFVSDREFFLLS